ncbi:unnamed protein product [Clavelina lepadiformis]|uniref:Serpentine receptor class gamma n=1 Tax=Clavelina lepadiformis TaxID=159417 RepID=A0ABP0GZG1_CLALP
MKDLTLNGTLGSLEVHVKGPPQRGPIDIIVVITIIEILEFFIFFFMIQTSWTTFVAHNRKSIFRFLTSLSALKKSFVLSAVVILLLNTLFLARICLPLEYDDELCTLMLRLTGSVSYNIGMFTVYIYLWMRQYHLHSSPVLRSALPRWLPVLSRVSFVLTLVAFIVPLASIWVNGNVMSVYRDGFCYHKASAVKIFPSLMVGATLLTQITYTLLFCATLKIHEKVNKTAANRKTQSSKKIALRCLYFAVLAISTDGIALLSINVTGGWVPEVYIHLFPKLDLFINLLCMLLCFNNLPDVMKKVVRFLSCGKIVVAGNEDQVTVSRRISVPAISFSLRTTSEV